MLLDNKMFDYVIDQLYIIDRREILPRVTNYCILTGKMGLLLT